jgi:aspartyl-tRNA(Asn)/glutamyl-tRNA(Gln) amidotransferase subunit B
MKIGLEVHLKLNIDKKLFCNCLNNEYSTINTNFCEICLGEPGSLPLLNLEAVSIAFKCAKLLEMEYNPFIYYLRKHYSYHDLPKGYQLTMDEEGAIGKNGNIKVYKGYKYTEKIVPLKILILEEDPCSIVKGILNYNRSGSPLLELVTEPVFTSADEVVDFLKTLIQLLSVEEIIESSNKKHFRADVNISTNEYYRTELKNLGSIEDITNSIKAEVKRQLETPLVNNETRCYNLLLNSTEFMRYKESAKDYAYLVETNIYPVQSKSYIQKTVYNVYKVYEQLAKGYKLNESRAWSYAKNKKLAAYLLEKLNTNNTVDFSVVDKMIKYNKIDYKILNKNISLEEYSKTFKKREAVNLQSVYYNLYNTNSKFKNIADFKDITAPSFNYIIGLIKKESSATYSEILSVIKKIWN